MEDEVGFCFAYAVHLETMCVELVLCNAFVTNKCICSLVLCYSFMWRQMRVAKRLYPSFTLHNPIFLVLIGLFAWFKERESKAKVTL